MKASCKMDPNIIRFEVYYSINLSMVNGRPNIRNLSVRRRWRGKNARDRINEINYKRIGAAFLALSAILIDEDETISIIFGIVAAIVIYKYWKIDQWDDEISDRVPLKVLTIEGTTEETCYSDFRFQKADLRSLFIALRFPDEIILPNRSKINGEAAFLLMLHRMAFPRRLVDEEIFFGREYSTVSRTFNYVVKLMDREHSHLLLDNLEFFLPRFGRYNECILAKISEANDGNIPVRESKTAFFLDGTKREICRPYQNNNIQRVVYDGRLHEHNLGFQGKFNEYELFFEAVSKFNCIHPVNKCF